MQRKDQEADGKSGLSWFDKRPEREVPVPLYVIEKFIREYLNKRL